MSSLSGDRGESRKPSRRRRGRGFCIFHPDAVTAKTISRLSKGVARLSANDDTTNAPDAPEPSVKQGEKAQICWSKASNSSIELPGDTSSSFGLYTQRSPALRVKLSLPSLNAGSKRSFSYVIDSSLSMNVASFSNSLRSSSITPLKSRVFCPLYFDAESSDSSMLSLTPPRSQPTASSSPIVSSSDDLQTISIISMRRRRWRKRRKGCWSKRRGANSVGDTEHNWSNWRTPVPLLADLSDSHIGSHRVHRRGVEFFDSDEDSSEEGPLKKARVTENVFESIWRHRCNCVGRPRRTASSSPKRFNLLSTQMHHEKMATDCSRKQRKPMRFRKSLLTTRSTPMTAPQDETISDGDHSSERPSSNLVAHVIGNFEDDEGDDERSDATPERK
uniref:Ovate family protein n=2 Tax=Mesocestoides corti TaxID=53468 RepID=A0A5K3EPA3_MESCO